MIYFAQPIDGGPVKIGHAGDVAARFKQLELHYGLPLALLATMPGGRQEERAVHDRFRHLRLDGQKRSGARPEQFRPDAELMAFIGRPLLVSPNPETVEAMKPGYRTLVIRMSVEYARWLEDAAKHDRTTVAGFLDRALADRAKADGYEPPPERIP